MQVAYQLDFVRCKYSRPGMLLQIELCDGHEDLCGNVWPPAQVALDALALPHNSCSKLCLRLNFGLLARSFIDALQRLLQAADNILHGIYQYHGLRLHW